MRRRSSAGSVSNVGGVSEGASGDCALSAVSIRGLFDDDMGGRRRLEKGY